VTFLVACPPAGRAPSAQPVGPSTLSPAVTPGPQQQSLPPARPRPEPSALLAVIIDDAGYSLDDLQPFLDIPGTFTIAVLPNLPHSSEVARRVIAAGKDLILHCPMEPSGGENPGPGALLTDQSSGTIEGLLAAAFASVPGAIGMNNHMGSRATADVALMTAALGYLKREGGFFIDSRTTADSVAPAVARRMGVPFAERDVFIDVDTSREQILESFDKGVSRAAGSGTAVLIGHVQNKGVADILRANQGSLAAQGVRLAPLRDVIRERERESAR
jgi:hypothetical protein